MNNPVPLVDIAAQQRDIAEQIRPEIDRILTTGAFIGGKDVADFEQSYAAYLQVGHCIGVANGTDAIEIALRATGVGPGDEVILPANTFIATAEAVARVGAEIVLVDVDPDAMLMDPALVPAAITERTKAIIPVHLYGQAAPVEQIAALSLPEGCVIIEDAAQSQGALRHGKPAGSLGTMAATSFYPGKNLGAAGDAGAVMTDDADLARVARLLGAHGSAMKYLHEIIGFNSRLDSIQAVVLSAKLTHLDRWNQVRRDAAARYEQLLAGVADLTLPQTMAGNEHVWHLYTVRVPERDAVLKLINDEGVGAGIHYPSTVHLSPAFAHLNYQRDDFPISEAAADELISLPIYGHITAEQQHRVADVVRASLSRV
jgi:dTDP-4-amino-4,6-dideoxygalactose transaminase